MPEVTHTSTLQTVGDSILFLDKNRETVINVDHISMEFNMASEKFNSLKEYAIALLKRQLFFESFLALDDICFEVKKGDVFGILGTNGSGKSTLLKIIAGVLEPTKGKCSVKGLIAPLIELGAGFDMELSARENIYLNGALLGYSKSFIDDHFEEIVDFAEISKFLDMPMKNYSSGMVARIAFAIATITIPDLLIVDEVLSVGDFMFQKKCEDRINELITKHGVTILIVSHNNDQIERLCNKAVWIEKGHIRLLGDSSKVCNAYRLLGGQTGSTSSEDYLFSLLQKMEQAPIELKHPPSIVADNHILLSSKIAWKGWGNSDDLNVVLVPDYAHSFSILASGIAGALNAPILPFDLEDIGSSIVSALGKLTPSRIFIIAYEENIESIKNELFEQLSVLKLNCEIKVLSCERDEVGLVCDVINFGISESIWLSRKAFVLSFSDNAISFIIASIAYRFRIPVVIVFDEKNACDARFIDTLKNAHIDEVVSFGAAADSEFVKSLNEHGFSIYQGKKKINTTTLASEFVISELNDYDEAYISSALGSDWQDLITVPSYIGKSESVLFLMDPTDLDSKANNIKLLEQAKPSKIDFIGKSLPIVDREITLYVAQK